MPGVTPSTITRPLQKVQTTLETIWGSATNVLATSKWMLVKPDPQMTPILKTVVVNEDRGSLAPGFVAYVPELGGAWTLSQDASFEDIEYSLSAMLGGIVPTGSFTWTHLGPLSSAYSPVTYRMEMATDIAAVVGVGATANKLQIKGNAKGNWTTTLSGFLAQFQPCTPIAITSSTNASPVEITTTALHGLITGQAVVIAGHTVNTGANGTWTIIVTSTTKFTLTGSVGNGVGGATGTITQTMTPAVADRVVEPILFAGQTALKIDPAGGTIGTTAVPGALVEFTLDLDNQAVPFFASDQKYPVDFAQEKLKVTLTLVLKWNSQVKALFDSTWAAGLASLFQIKATSGSKSCELDFSGVLESDPAMYKVNYNALTQEFKFGGIVDTGSFANYAKTIVINSVAALA